MTALNLEVGKSYRMRDDRESRIQAECSRAPGVFYGVYSNGESGTWAPGRWTRDGRWLLWIGDHPYDLIAPADDTPAPFSEAEALLAAPELPGEVIRLLGANFKRRDLEAFISAFPQVVFELFRDYAAWHSGARKAALAKAGVE